MKNDVGIIGAGVSGLSAGQLLRDRGENVSIFESKKMPGGLISCTRENGILFHRVGGHVFNTKNPEVANWFWTKVNKDEFSLTKRVAKIFIDNKILGYPIENYIYLLDEKIIINIISELINILQSEKNKAYADNFDDFLRINFGDTLYNLYFKPYNEKIWKADLSKIPLEWLDGKLPMPNIKDIILSNIIKKEEVNMVHSSFWYPNKNGSQFIADSLAKGLDISYNNKIKKIDNNNNKWTINNKNFNKIIYTGDVRKLSTLLSDKVLPVNLKNELKKLKSNGTSNVLCEIDSNNYSWMYFPEEKYKIHRIISTGNFAESNNGNSNRKTCTIEYSGFLSLEDMEKEIKKLPGNPNIIAYNYEPNSYIYHTNETTNIIDCVKSYLEKQSFYLVGRFAEWQYYNMDKAIEASMKLVNKYF